MAKVTNDITAEERERGMTAYNAARSELETAESKHMKKTRESIERLREKKAELFEKFGKDHKTALSTLARENGIEAPSGHVQRDYTGGELQQIATINQLIYAQKEQHRAQSIDFYSSELDRIKSEGVKLDAEANDIEQQLRTVADKREKIRQLATGMKSRLSMLQNGGVDHLPNIAALRANASTPESVRKILESY